MAGLNKTIWINWFQGWDNAPEIAHHCVESWRHYNPDWKIVQMDAETCHEYSDFRELLPGLDTNNISKSDILRLSILKNHGGVWVDSTLWCNKPLDSWLLDIKDSFIFTRYDRLMDNWFMAAEDDSYLISALYDITLKWWTWRIAETDQYEQRYAWMHGLLSQLISNDRKARNVFAQWDHIDVLHDTYNQKNGKGKRGRSAHLFTPYMKYFYEPISDEIKNRIDSKIDPVYKLTYKTNTEWQNPDKRGIHPGDEKILFDYPENSEVNYLLSTIK